MSANTNILLTPSKYVKSANVVFVRDDEDTELLPMSYLENVLKLTGFQTIKDLQDELDKYDRLHKIPAKLERKLLKIFECCIDEDAIGTMSVSDRNDNYHEVQFPFVLANQDPLVHLSIREMFFNQNGQYFTIDLRCVVEAPEALKPNSDQAIVVAELCNTNCDEITIQQRSKLVPWLKEVKLPAGLAKDDEFLSNLTLKIQDQIEMLLAIQLSEKMNVPEEKGELYVVCESEESELGLYRPDSNRL